MPAPTIRQVLLGIQTRLATIPGLTVTDYSPGQITPPHAIINVPPIGNYLTSLGGRRPLLEPTVLVLVSAVIDQIGQLQLADYADPDGAQSIPAAVAADPTLGGLVGTCQVISFAPLGLQDVGLIGYFGGTFTLRVT